MGAQPRGYVFPVLLGDLLGDGVLLLGSLVVFRQLNPASIPFFFFFFLNFRRLQNSCNLRQRCTEADDVIFIEIREFVVFVPTLQRT